MQQKNMNKQITVLMCCHSFASGFPCIPPSARLHETRTIRNTMSKEFGQDKNKTLLIGSKLQHKSPGTDNN